MADTKQKEGEAWREKCRHKMGGATSASGCEGNENNNEANRNKRCRWSRKHFCPTSICHLLSLPDQTRPDQTRPDRRVHFRVDLSRVLMHVPYERSSGPSLLVPSVSARVILHVELGVGLQFAPGIQLQVLAQLGSLVVVALGIASERRLFPLRGEEPRDAFSQQSAHCAQSERQPVLRGLWWVLGLYNPGEFRGCFFYQDILIF